MKRAAFTSVELMLVLVLLGILVGSVAVFSRLSLVRADLNAQTTELVTLLRLAQSKAAAGEGGTSHGVHLESDQFVLFEGPLYSAEAEGNLFKTLPDTLLIQNLSLNGGGSDILFSPPEGETATFGSFELSSTASGQSHSITINSLGLVHY